MWRDQVGRWIRGGVPSIRKRDAGKNRIVELSPITANGWLSILKVICAAMTRHYELARDPAKPVEYFPVPRIYTREQPNALTAAHVPVVVAKTKELHPQHFAMVLLGFGIGARPSTLRVTAAESSSPLTRIEHQPQPAEHPAVRPVLWSSQVPVGDAHERAAA